ncbi:dimethyladenosine transferase 2, mitochondrial isoform X2 [Venturia canescens]|uniref:dimethyladenosine transferase 2, mitochondrial isoform X2 n=1 Tax=Venturia canescens TaxID=32260 RepID=UPI001C9CFC98|nr:dimethyladenosine transferase 2, mitochondrial isoform X2 [Venturia canescens]
MKNFYNIAVKCRRVVEKSLDQCNANFFSRHLTSQKKPRKSRTKTDESCSSTDSISEAKDAITAESRANPKASILYLMDQEIAKTIAGLIVAHRSVKTPHVMQMNPGLGVLTEELLKAGIQEIEMFEGTEYFWPRLMDLQLRFHKNLYLQKVNFGHIFEVAYRDWKNETNDLDDYFNNVKEKAWRNLASYEIIGSVADRNFTYRLVQSLVLHSNLRQKGRMILYLCVPPSVMLCKVLGELPRSAFYPQYSKSKKQRKHCREELYKKDRESMFLIKIEGNRHLFNRKFTEKDLLVYYYFVKHHFKARVTRVIPALESWVPGCGPALIKDGFNIFTQFGELLPHEVLKLYLKFKSLPGFKKSAFLSSNPVLSNVNTFFSDMEQYDNWNENTVDFDNIFQTSVKEFEDGKKELIR